MLVLSLTSLRQVLGNPALSLESYSVIPGCDGLREKETRRGGDVKRATRRGMFRRQKSSKGSARKSRPRRGRQDLFKPSPSTPPGDFYSRVDLKLFDYPVCEVATQREAVARMPPDCAPLEKTPQLVELPFEDFPRRRQGACGGYCRVHRRQASSCPA